MNPFEQGIRTVDAWQQRHRVTAFIFAVFKKFGDDQAGNLVALLTYFAFLATFPLLLALSGILGLVLHGNPSLQASIQTSALSEFPIIGTQLQSQVGVASLGHSTPALIIGIIGAILGGQGLANAIQNTFNTVWDVPKVARPGFPSNYLRTFGLLGLIGVSRAVSQPLESHLEHFRVDQTTAGLRVNAIGPEQVRLVLDRRVPVGQHDARVVAGRGGQGRIDLLLPWPRLEGIDQDEPAARPDLGEELADLVSGDSPVGPEADYDDRAQQSSGLELGDDLEAGAELAADHGVDVDPRQCLLQRRGRRHHDGVADRGNRPARHRLRAGRRRSRGRRRAGPGSRASGRGVAGPVVTSRRPRRNERRMARPAER